MSAASSVRMVLLAAAVAAVPLLATSTRQVSRQTGAGTDGSAAVRPFTVVDTGVTTCYDDRGPIACPVDGQPFSGQDAQAAGHQPAYRDNGDGTISDLNTGLMWVKARGTKVTWADAAAGASASRVGGYTDWRMPTIKELYSLIIFTGSSRGSGAGPVPYLDTAVFEFAYGDTSAGERPIDSQDWSATAYVGTTMDNAPTIFGVNFADGRIKGYPRDRGRNGGRHKLYVRYVRGNPSYGVNDFADNGDGTVTDRATGLHWQKADSRTTLDWKGALAFCSALTLAGHDDWRLPDAKELESIVDYTRAPAVTGSAAINPVFAVSAVESYFWSSTTHLEGPGGPRGGSAVYVAFGRALGYMRFPFSAGLELIDVHGAGAQRSDPKTGNPAAFPQGLGPQGDDVRILNYARCAR